CREYRTAVTYCSGAHIPTLFLSARWPLGFRQFRAKPASADLADAAGVGPALDHAQHVAARAVRLAGQLVHQFAHQEHAAAADADLAGVKVRHLVDVEGLALVEQVDLEGVAVGVALDLNLGVGAVAVGVADDVAEGLAGRQDNGVSGALVEVAGLTDA